MNDSVEKTSEVLQTSEVSTNSILQEALADQRRRCRHGEPFQAESYLERHPALRNHSEAILDLIYQEMVLRESRGETPALAEYLERFPALAALPRVRLGGFPTPVERIELDDGRSLLVKRDDRCGGTIGGNKLRALEWLLGGITPGSACSP